MALSNNYVNGNSWSQLKGYTHPNTNPVNALKAKISKMPCCDDAPTPNFDWTVDGTGVTVSFQENTIGANEVRFYNIRINDQSGNEAVGQFDIAIMADVDVDTTNLNQSDDWNVQVVVGALNAASDCDCGTELTYQIVGAKPSQTGTITEVQGAGTLGLQGEAVVNDVVTVAKAVVADAGTLAFGAVAIDDVAIANIFFEETAGVSPVTITSITTTADVTGSIYTPAIIAANGEIVGYQITVDTSMAASYSKTITVASNDPANPSYLITITATVS